MLFAVNLYLKGKNKLQNRTVVTLFWSRVVSTLFANIV